MKLVIALLLLLVQTAGAASFPLKKDTVQTPPHLFVVNQLVTLKPAALEKWTGKKLSLVDKLKLKILQKKLKKQYAEERSITPNQKKLGLWAMILGIASIGLLFIGAGVTFLVALLAAIAAVILGFKSVKGNSNAKGLIGIIAGFLTVLLTLLATVAVLAWGGFF